MLGVFGDRSKRIVVGGDNYRRYSDSGAQCLKARPSGESKPLLTVVNSGSDDKARGGGGGGERRQETPAMTTTPALFDQPLTW